MFSPSDCLRVARLVCPTADGRLPDRDFVYTLAFGQWPCPDVSRTFGSGIKGFCRVPGVPGQLEFGFADRGRIGWTLGCGVITLARVTDDLERQVSAWLGVDTA